jgi:hypothetical protein
VRRDRAQGFSVQWVRTCATLTTVSRTSNRKRRRKPKRPLPRVPDYVRYSGGGRRYWRLGGPLTRDHEAEAKAAQAAKQPGPLGRLILRMLGGGKSTPPR